jgi:hypothetical protein
VDVSPGLNTATTERETTHRRRHKSYTKPKHNNDRLNGKKQNPPRRRQRRRQPPSTKDKYRECPQLPFPTATCNKNKIVGDVISAMLKHQYKNHVF